MTETNDEWVMNQTNKIKLIKNSRGFNWEITQLNHDLDELERLNSELERRFVNEAHKDSNEQ